jgi:hypothetical protein
VRLAASARVFALPHGATPLPKPPVRRNALGFLAALAFCALASTAASLPRQSAEGFLREIYVAEARRIAHSQTLGETELIQLFAPVAGELLRAAFAHPDQALREGPSPNPLCGWGLASGAKVELLGVSTVLGTHDAPTLLVDLLVSGAPRRIVVDLVEHEGAWRIASIVYDEGEDFLSYERRLARR